MSPGALDAENLHNTVLTLVLRTSASLGTLVYVPSVYSLLQQRMYVSVLIDTVVLGVVFALLFFQRIPFHVRATIACLIFNALGLGLLLTVGSVAQVYLIGASVVTVLLFGTRVGLVAAVFCAFSVLMVGALGDAPMSIGAKGGVKNNFVEWALITINFALVNVLIVLAVGVVMTAMKNALEREISTRTLLRSLIDALPDVIFTKDTEGRFVNANAAALTLFGVTREDQIAGKTAYEVLGSASRRCLRR